jgi:hypothetical protein
MSNNDINDINNKNDNDNNDINDHDSVLVYIGSAADTLPIEDEMARTFVYVDALPDAIKDACIFTKMDRFLNELQTRLERCWTKIDVECVRENEYYILRDEEWFTLHFFPNTIDSHEPPPELADLYAAATAMYVAGHVPDRSVYDRMPKLRRVYVTSHLLYDLPEPVQAMATKTAQWAWDPDRGHYYMEFDVDDYLDDYLTESEQESWESEDSDDSDDSKDSEDSGEDVPREDQKRT